LIRAEAAPPGPAKFDHKFNKDLLIATV
jgi:hypothetical protein